MKTTTKALILTLTLIPAIMLVSSFTNPPEGAKYATMRTLEVAMGGSKIIIAYDGKTEEIELARGTTGNQTPNTLQINQAINALASKGYELVGQSGGDYISMYTFIKK